LPITPFFRRYPYWDVVSPVNTSIWLKLDNTQNIGASGAVEGVEGDWEAAATTLMASLASADTFTESVTITSISETPGYLGTAEALDDCEAYVWDAARIQRLEISYPRLAANCLRISLHYVAQFAERHITLASCSVEERLARTLTALGDQAGEATPGGVEVTVKNEQLASLANINFFTASRLLNKFQRMGAVKKSRGKVLIECPEKLLIEVP
jgi:hypothetical protein